MRNLIRDKRRSRRRVRATSLIEILIAVVLLAFSVAAMVTLWGVSRRITERSRDTAEYFVVARQEIERDKASKFMALFIDAGVTATRWTDYDQQGTPLATGLAANSAATANAYYRAKSAYTLAATGSETGDKQLGVQKVEIFIKNGATTFDTSTVVYQTAAFYTKPGV